jgi:hypothetical protein
VTDPEPPPGPDDADAGAGFASLLNSTPKVITAITALIGAVSGLLIALNKVGVIGGGGSSGTTTTEEEAESLFKPGKSPAGRVYFDGKTMYVRVNNAKAPMVLRADQSDELQDVSMNTRVRWVSGATDYGFSLLCRYRNPKNYYLLGVLSGGRYNIARYRGGRLTSLTRGFQTSSHIGDDDNEVTARCVGESPTTLTLEVNGHKIGQASDPTGLPAGNIGIRVGTGESFVTTSFEDFVLSHL